MHTLTLYHVGHIALGEGLPGGALNAEDGENIAGFDFCDVFHLVSMHFNHSADFEFFVQFVIPDALTFFQLSLINSDVS